MRDDTANDKGPFNGSETEIGEKPGSDEVAPAPRPRRHWGVWLAVGLLSAGILGLAATGYMLWSNMQDDLDRRTQEIESKVNTQAGELRTLRADLGDLSQTLGRLDAALAALDIPPDLTPQVLGVQRDLGSTIGQLDSLASEVDSLMWDITDVKSCINTYMDTIGRWSRNVYSYYSYYSYYYC